MIMRYRCGQKRMIHRGLGKPPSRVTYYGRFYQSSLYPVMAQVDLHLAKWIARKHKRTRGNLSRACQWLRRIRRECPMLFVHWRLAYRS